MTDFSSIDFFGYPMNPLEVLTRLTIPILVIFCFLVLGIFFNRFVSRYIMRHKKDEDCYQDVFMEALKGLPIAWCLGVGIYWAIGLVNFNPALVKPFSNMLITVIVVTMTRVIAKGLTGAIELRAKRLEKKQMKNGTMSTSFELTDDFLPQSTILTNIVNFVIYGMGLLVLLQCYGISITPMITALGIGSLAVALGLQSSLSNLFAGLHLILSDQLHKDDYIKLSSGEAGKVQDITWRFTTLKTLTGNAIVIPNQNIASAVLTNYHAPYEHIAVIVNARVGFEYAANLERVERITLEVAGDVMKKFDKTSELRKIGEEEEVSTDADLYFSNIGEYSVDFRVVLHTIEFERQFELKHLFIKALLKRFAQEGIDVPYPVYRHSDEYSLRRLYGEKNEEA